MPQYDYPWGNHSHAVISKAVGDPPRVASLPVKLVSCAFEDPREKYPKLSSGLKSTAYKKVRLCLLFYLGYDSHLDNDHLSSPSTNTAIMLLIVCSTLLFASCLTSALTIPSLRTLNLARAFGGTTSPQPDHACTKDAQWLGDGYSQENCMATVQRLWNADVSTNDHTQFEFLAPGAQNKTSLPAMQTPRRYVSGS